MQNESNSYTMYRFPYHSDNCDPVPLLGQAHTGMTCTVMSRVVHIMLNVLHYYANSLCSANVTIMLKYHHCYAPL